MDESLKPVSLLTIKQAAERLNCSESTVYGHIEDGELPVVPVGRSKGYRIDPRDIEQFIEKRKGIKPGTPVTKVPAQPKLKHIKF